MLLRRFAESCRLNAGRLARQYVLRRHVIDARFFGYIFGVLCRQAPIARNIEIAFAVLAPVNERNQMLTGPSLSRIDSPIASMAAATL